MPTLPWHPQFDNPSFLGWSVVAAYLLAAVSCGWAAFKADKSVSEGSGIWWLLAVGLLFLGINKQLNLQTLMIVIGRRASLVGGWYERRRFAQAVFCAVFALLGLCLLGFFAACAKRFIAKNRLAFAGVIVLLSFVVLRASTINHANELFGVELKDARWAWVLELCGSILIALSAAAAAKPAACRDRGKA
jgi:FtsH-binding integral membrane protein